MVNGPFAGHAFVLISVFKQLLAVCSLIVQQIGLFHEKTHSCITKYQGVTNPQTSSLERVARGDLIG